MAENYKHLYAQTKKMLEKYQDELVPGLRAEIEELKAKLAVYEDTGLTPEDIRELCTPDAYEVAKLILELIETGGGYHLQELLKAGSEGRLIVLPCKVGEAVYRIYDDCDFPGDCGTKRMCKGCGYRNVFIEEQAFYVSMLNQNGTFGYPYYLTREEAEAALKGGSIYGTD